MRRLAVLVAALCIASAVQPQTAPAPDAAELLFWESIRNSTNRADFEEYLRQYPQGKFAGLARNRISAGPACDISGTWSGEVWMEGHTAPFRMELQVSGTRISGVRPATTVASRVYPAAPIAGEVHQDGTITLEEAPTSPSAGPTTFNLFINNACSMLRGKVTVMAGGRRYDGFASYLRQSIARTSP